MALEMEWSNKGLTATFIATSVGPLYRERKSFISKPNLIIYANLPPQQQQQQKNWPHQTTVAIIQIDHITHTHTHK